MHHVADGFQHDQRHRQSGRGLHLAGRGLDEVAAAEHAEPRRAPDIVIGAELAGLQDDLEMGRAAGLLDGDDLVVDLHIAAGQERAPVDHHVDLVGAGGDRGLGVVQLDRERGLPGREGGGHAGDVHAGAGQLFGGGGDHRRVDADGGDRRAVWGGGVRPLCLGTQCSDLARGVGTFEGGEVDHADREIDRVGLGRGLDGSGGQHRRPGVRANRVHAGKTM